MKPERSGEVERWKSGRSDSATDLKSTLVNRQSGDSLHAWICRKPKGIRTRGAGTGVAHGRGMAPCVSTTPPKCSIAPTEKGWLLTIQNEHFSVMQVFRSATTATLAVDRMLEFFHTMSSQPPRGSE